MREFFKPMRGKLGAAMLVAASVLMALWVRNQFRYDCITVAFPRWPICVYSALGDVEFSQIQRHRRDPVLKPVKYTSGSPVGKLAEPIDGIEWDPDRFLWRLSRICTMPHWSIVLPLAFLSACLLLSKPRPNPKQSVTHA